MTLSGESSDELTLGLSSASDSSVALSGDKLAVSSISEESSENSGGEVPADGSSLLSFWLLVDSTSLGTLSVSSVNLSSLPGTSPCASGPLSESSSVLSASLTLSHPDSHSSSSGDSSSEASDEGSSASSESGAVLSSSSPLSNHLGAFEFDNSGHLASGESSVSKLEGGALSAIPVVALQNLRGGSLSQALGPLSVSLLVGGAFSSILVGELLADNQTSWGADLSGEVSLSPDLAIVISIFEFPDNSGSLHFTSPLALSLDE